jgi:hypothetical protein
MRTKGRPGVDEADGEEGLELLRASSTP